MIDSPQVQCAIEAAKAGGAVLLQFDGPSLDRTIKTDEWDFVTEADLAAEKVILEVIQKHFPEDRILAEESGWLGNPEAEACWVIDPLDGTHNFANGSHNYGVMISRVMNGCPQVAAVFNPALDILVVAEAGKGAWTNGEQLPIAQPLRLADADVLVNHWHDFPHTPTLSATKSYIQELGINPEGPGSSASIALGLATGEYHAWVSHAWCPWDFLPLWLLSEEAGLTVTTIYGETLDWQSKTQSMLSAVPGVYDELRAYVDSYEQRT